MSTILEQVKTKLEEISKDKEIKHPEIKKGSIFDKVGMAHVTDDNIFSIIGKLLDTADIELKTSLSRNEIIIFNKAIRFAEKYRTPSLKLYIYGEMILKVSQDRKGREELIDAISSSIAKIISDEKRKPIEV